MLFMTVVVSIAFFFLIVLNEQGSCNVQPKIAEHKIAK